MKTGLPERTTELFVKGNLSFWVSQSLKNFENTNGYEVVINIRLNVRFVL